MTFDINPATATKRAIARLSKNDVAIEQWAQIAFLFWGIAAGDAVRARQTVAQRVNIALSQLVDANQIRAAFHDRVNLTDVADSILTEAALPGYISISGWNWATQKYEVSHA